MLRHTAAAICRWSYMHRPVAGALSEAARRPFSQAPAPPTIPRISRGDPVPEALKASLVAPNFKSELRRRDRVHTGYFSFPVTDVAGNST